MHRKKKEKVRRTEVFNLLVSTLYRETHFLSYDGHLNLFFILTFPFLEIRISLFMRRKFRMRTNFALFLIFSYDLLVLSISRLFIKLHLYINLLFNIFQF